MQVLGGGDRSSCVEHSGTCQAGWIWTHMCSHLFREQVLSGVILATQLTVLPRKSWISVGFLFATNMEERQSRFEPSIRPVTSPSFLHWLMIRSCGPDGALTPMSQSIARTPGGQTLSTQDLSCGIQTLTRSAVKRQSRLLNLNG